MTRVVIRVVAKLLWISAVAHAQPVQLTYLGTAGWIIAHGQTVILIDPYLTRARVNSPNDAVSPTGTRPLVTGNSIVEPDTAVIDAHIQRASCIFPTHTRARLAVLGSRRSMCGEFSTSFGTSRSTARCSIASPPK
jgi:hypothetical protein